MKIRKDKDGDGWDIEAQPHERVILVVAKNMAGLRDIAARRGKHKELHESFPEGAKGMLSAFTLAGIDDKLADDVISRLIADL